MIAIWTAALGAMEWIHNMEINSNMHLRIKAITATAQAVAVLHLVRQRTGWNGWVADTDATWVTVTANVQLQSTSVVLMETRTLKAKHALK